MVSQELKELCGKLCERKFTIAFAESATAGHLVSAFAEAPDAGKFLKGGIVCYDACLKETLLQVPAELIEKHTAESSEVTETIVKSLGKLIEADVYVAVTGLVAPGGSESDEKPVGTMFISILYDQQTYTEQLLFVGTPQQIVKHTLDHVVATLLTLLD